MPRQKSSAVLDKVKLQGNFKVDPKKRHTHTITFGIIPDEKSDLVKIVAYMIDTKKNVIVDSMIGVADARFIALSRLAHYQTTLAAGNDSVLQDFH